MYTVHLSLENDTIYILIQHQWSYTLKIHAASSDAIWYNSPPVLMWFYSMLYILYHFVYCIYVNIFTIIYWDSFENTETIIQSIIVWHVPIWQHYINCLIWCCRIMCVNGIFRCTKSKMIEFCTGRFMKTRKNRNMENGKFQHRMKDTFSM